MEMRFDVLDHGYVAFIESWGSDARVIESARMSTGKGFLGWGPSCPYAAPGEEHLHDLKLPPTHPDPKVLRCDRCGIVVPKPGDEKLLRYLHENKHATPFEFGGLVIEVQAPIFVFREACNARHVVEIRERCVNARSSRCRIACGVGATLMMNAGGSNKQAGTIQAALALTEEQARLFRASLEEHYEQAQILYQTALNVGIPKEIARVHLPVGRYSRMRASANLRNWLAFLTLRMAPTAQWEIRQYANAVGKLVRENFPQTWELFAGSVGR